MKKQLHNYWRQQAQLVFLTICFVAVAHTTAQGQERMRMWGTPPLQSPKFQASGSGVMMGPNPLLGQRRSEHKRAPTPPTIIANVHNFGHPGWMGSPGSVDALLRVSKSNHEMWYGWEHLDVGELSAKHEANIRIRTPILYLAAYYPLDFNDDQRRIFRDYVLEGGTMLINCCGQAAAFASVQQELAAMFPQHPLRLLPPDHPLYRSQFRIERVNWPSDMTARTMDDDLGALFGFSEIMQDGVDVKNLPRMRAVTIGTRAAVIVSYEDMACGWNQWDNPNVKRYSIQDSTAIGANIMSYVLGEMRYGQFMARTHEISGPSIAPRRQLVFAQIIHGGNWNPNPSGVPYLLRALAETTSLNVRFERNQFELMNPDLFAYPLLYMTGTWDPDLSDAEKAILRRYLREGGSLLVDSASGRLEFDLAFRKLTGELFPEAGLRKLPENHALFKVFHKIETLHVNHEVEPVPPEIEGVFINDRPVILYSPLGLSDGWAPQYSAYARAYESNESLKMTANMIVYLMLTVRESGGG